MQRRTIWSAEDGAVEIIDQTRLPFELRIRRLETLEDAAEAIASMQVRGAPLIGVTAAYGVCLALAEDASDRTLAAALEGAGRTKDTILEFETLIRLAPDDLVNYLALAKAFQKTRQPDKARDVLTKLLELDAEFPGAKELLEQLGP